jgi:excisionase family DNA binding protein
MAEDTTTTDARPRLPAKTGASRTRHTLKLDDGYLPLTELATYTGLSVRFLQDLITRRVDPLPHYRFGTKVEVRRSEFDAWAQAHHRVAPAEPFDAAAFNEAKIRGRK